MSSFRTPQNPGIGGLAELTSSEETFIQNLAGLTYAQGDILYVDGTGNLVNLGAGTSGHFLKTQGAGANPVWAEASAAAGATTALDNLASVAINTTLVSDTDNTDALGTSAKAWSDIFLGSGAVITFNSAPSTADITITHSADTLTFAGGTVALGTATATGGLTGNVTGNVTGSAATVTGAAQTAITSLGTLTALDVDNININGNTISSTAGTDLLVTPLAGQQIVLDGTIIIDAGVVTGATSITSTTFVGALTGTASGNLVDVVDDTTPTLGGALDAGGFDINNGGVIFLTEQAAAEADVAGKGQIWVLTATPNVLKFTDDAGTDFTIATNATTTLGSLGTVSTSLTGVLRADSGVLSADTDVTDLVDNLAVSQLADGTDGELITWDATGAPATVATGSSGQVLTSNGAGAAPTFQAAAGGSPGGSTTQLQYNNAGAFGGIAGMTTDGTTVTTTADALGTTITARHILQNTTDATSGATTQISPAISFTGEVWASTPGATTAETTSIYNSPYYLGSGATTSRLVIALGSTEFYRFYQNEVGQSQMQLRGGDGNFATISAPLNAGVDTVFNLPLVSGTLATRGANTFTDDQTLGTNDLLMTGSIAATGSRVTKGWFTDLESTNMPTVGGTAILTSLTAPQFTTIELGHANDTTFSRASAGVAAIEGVNILTTAGGTLTGTINLGEGADTATIGLVVDNSLSADERYSGITTPGTAGATLAFGDICYLDVTAGEWLPADASAVGTAGDVPLGICVDASTDGAATSMLLIGTVRSAAFPASVALGAPLYVSETAGDITATAPTTTDSVMRRVGWAITTEPNTVYFNPSNDYVTHV